MARKTLIAGNWKMNGTYGESVVLAQEISNGFYDDWADQVEVVVCPPFIDLKPVKTVDPDLATIVASEKIPAVFKQIQAIRLHRECVSARIAELPVGDRYHTVFPHRLHNRSQMIATRGNLVDHDTVFDRKMLADGVADSKRIEHPLLQPVIVDLLRIGYIVEIAPGALAVDHDAELAVDRLAPTVERGSVERPPVAVVCGSLPFVGQILVADFPGHADLFDQPCIFSQRFHIF